MRIRKLLLACGVLSSLLYGWMCVGIRYEGYSLVSQVPSELTAIGAPTRALWAVLGPVYDVLLLAFGIGVWMSAGERRRLRIVGGLLIAFAVLGAVLWPFAAMHQREVLAAGGGTFSDTLHKILGLLAVVFMVALLASGASALGKGFRAFSIADAAVIFVFGFLTGLESPKVGANLPTPWIGLWERLSIAGFLLWIAVLAIALWREGVESPSHDYASGRAQGSGLARGAAGRQGDSARGRSPAGADPSR